MIKFIDKLDGVDSLGSISESAQVSIRKHSGAIAKVLRKAQRLNGLGDAKDVITADEAIKILNKENGLMNDDEIRAWVYYKRSIGVPMKGWEKYFTKGTGNNEKLLTTTVATTIRDKNFVELKLVPARTQLGLLCTGKGSEGWLYFTDKAGSLCMVGEDVVRVENNPYKADQKEIDKMVTDGVLFYNSGRYLPYAIYVYANSYDRTIELDEDKDFIIKNYGKRVYENHRKVIDEARPEQLSVFDPIKENRPHISPFSKFAQEFEIVEVDEKAPFELCLPSCLTSVSLTDAYMQMLTSLPREMCQYPNINGSQICYVCFNRPRQPRSYDKETWELFKGRCFAECERLFGVFIETCLTFRDKQRLDMTWNRMFNGFPAVPSNKVPIALPMSRIVRGGTFELRPAQREGVAFMELAQSGCVAFDVGVGKTFTAIAEVACAMQQGRCKRPLIVVPNSTYQNWIMEIIGKGSVAGLLTNTGISLNCWFNLGSDITARESDIKDGTITLVTKEGLKKFGFSDWLSDALVEDFKTILGQVSHDMDSKAQAKFNERIDSLLGRGQKSARLDFDACGFDYIVIDEAHNYKNVFSKIRPDGSRSALKSRVFHASAAEPSDIGLKGFIFCNYIQRMYGGNVMLLTATPFTNAPLEIFSMLSFVAMEELRRRGLDNVHRFFETFVNEEYDEIVDASLNIKNDYVTKSFNNRRILQSLIYANFDYKTGDEAGVRRPAKINIPLLYQNGKMLPKNKQILSYLKMTDRQELNQKIINALINAAGKGSESSKGRGKGGDSILSGMGSSLNNALSPFLFKIARDIEGKVRRLTGLSDSEIGEINREPHDYEEFINESPKIRFACECIKSVREWHRQRGEDCSGQVLYADRGKQYFDLIKAYLENTCGFERGLTYVAEDIDDKNGRKTKRKVDEVEIISGGISETRKDLLMRAFNDGVIKVIIGTSTIKEGVNLQRRSTVLYNLYPNWNPTDVQQLEGRIYRQGNTFQFVRIVMPLMQNSMDTFVFQKLQEKTDRINDIWYRADRGNVLNVDSLDPKEVKFALITDIDQLVRVQVGKERDDIDREIDILKDELRALANFKHQYSYLLRYRDYVLADIRNSLDLMGRYVETISNRPTEDQLKKMTADERGKAVKLLERYDELMRFVGQSSYEDKELVQMSRKLANIYTLHSTWNTDSLANYIKDVAKTEDSVLAKRGYNRNSDIGAIVDDLKTELKKLEDDKDAAASQDHYQEIYDYIVRKKREMNIVGQSIDSRIEEFSGTNYVMQYPFDPTLQVRNNELPDVGDMKPVADEPVCPATTNDEADDEMELFEMEAEALEMELAMTKGARQAETDGYPERIGNVAAEDLKRVFGFRYVNVDINLDADHEQDMLNISYDTFRLLARVIRQPMQSIGLDGNLTLNIGLRKMEFRTGACYVQNLRALNFKSRAEYKHVAHEWLHGFDHYLSYVTGHQRTRDALRLVGNAIQNTPFEERSKMAAVANNSTYWQEPDEMLARAFEIYVKDRMQELGENDEHLVSPFRGNPYPDFSNEKDAGIKAAFDEVFSKKILD